MKILWVHNFNPKIKNSGVFMHQSKNFIAKNYSEFEVHELYLGNLRNPLVIIYSILKIIFISKDYGVIHSQYGSMCGFITSFAFGKKVITLRGSDWYKKEKVGWFSAYHNRLQNFLTRLTLNRYNIIVVVSNRMKAEVVKLANKSIVVIPSAIDPDKFFPMDKNECRKKNNLPLDKRIFLYPVMQDTNPVKRPSLVKKVKENLSDSTIILTASGVNHDDMVFLYNAVDAVFLPSMYEGWPNVIKEGLLCNTPFISTDISDLSEIASRNSSCIIVPPEPSAIIKIMENASFIKDVKLRSEVEWMSLDKLNDKLVSECYL